MNYNELLCKAEEYIGTIQSNEVFFVKDLFRGTEWNELERGEKLGFGRCFKKMVMEHSILNVEYIGKADNNSAQYKKV